MSEEQTPAPLWEVYIGQNGTHLKVILTNDQAAKVQNELSGAGRPFGVWITYEGRVTGITINPRRGGVICNIQHAQPLPVDGSGNVLTVAGIEALAASGQAPAWLEAKDQRKGEVVFPHWGEEEVPPNAIAAQLAELRAQLGTLIALQPGSRAAPPPEPGPNGRERGPDGRFAKTEETETPPSG